MKQWISQGTIWIKVILYKHGAAFGLTAVLLLALALRLWGNDFGLPYLYHPDEDAVVMPAITILKSGDLEPTRMEYGTLYIYVLTAVSALTYINSARQGLIASPDQLPIYERGVYPAIYDHAEYFLAARIMSAILGVGIVLLVYMLTTRLGNRRQGFIAAAITAVLPDLSKHAHFATPDTPLTFFSLLALYLLIRAYDHWDEDSLWAYAGAGFVSGLAVSTKYNGAVLAAPVLLIPLLKAKRLDDVLNARALAGPIGMALGFLAGTPFALLNMPKFLYWVGYSLNLYDSPVNEAVSTSWQWHLAYHLQSPDALVFCLGLVGFFFSWRAWGWRRAALVNVVAVLMWFAIVSQLRREARMWLPTAPLFVMWTAVLIDTFAVFLYHLFNRLQAKWVIPVFLTLLVSLPLFWNTIQINQRFQETDVRTLAQQWIEANVTPGTPIAVEYFAPQLDTAVWPVTKLFSLDEEPVHWYQEQGIRYLVLSEAGHDSTKMTTETSDARQAFADSLCSIVELSGPFLSADVQRMWIYQVPPCSD